MISNKPFYLYNSLSQKKEEFIPHEDGVVRIYNCGPTVYQSQHIGNMRRYVIADLLHRILLHKGYDVRSITNITDVGHLTEDDRDEGEDKIIAAAQKEMLDPFEIANKYTNVFFEDLRLLNVLDVPTTHVQNGVAISGWPRATEHIENMISMIVALIDKGFAYETSRGIYFDVTKADSYGKLSGNTLDALEAGARVAVDSEKRHPFDFALWVKAPREHIMQWDSPWGKGYPGWHIECSAMGLELLGEYIDIHTGGVDNKFPHHENEIAQSEGVLGHPFVRYWIHNEHILMNGEKMSKSVGNVVLLHEILQTQDDADGLKYSAMHVRFLFLLSHYRSKVNFTFSALHQAKENYKRIQDFILQALESHDKQVSCDDFLSIETLKHEILSALADDMNTPQVITIVLQFIRKYYESGCIFSKDNQERLRQLFLDINELLGLQFLLSSNIPDQVLDLVKQIDAARSRRDYSRADMLRESILDMGYRVQYTKEGTIVVPKSL